MKQIEIEKKFSITKKQIEELEKKALFVSEEFVKDCYFDTKEFGLTTKNLWLRKRQNDFELKVGLTKKIASVTHFEEIVDEKKIQAALNLSSHDSMIVSLESAKIYPFLSFVTRRKKLKIDPYIIDLDYADFGDLNYFVAEIEILVSNKNEIEKAEKKLLEFAKSLGWKTNNKIEGKVQFYLRNRSFSHYEKLLKSGVLSE